TRVRAGIPQPHALHREVSARVRWLQTGSTLSITMSRLNAVASDGSDLSDTFACFRVRASSAPDRPVERGGHRRRSGNPRLKLVGAQRTAPELGLEGDIVCGNCCPEVKQAVVTSW